MNPQKPDKPSRSKPSRSGADTPRSSDLIGPGGKVRAEALARRAAPPHDPEPPAQPADATPADPSEGALAALPDDPDSATIRSAEDDAPNRVVFVLQRDLDKRLDKYLSDRIPFMSRSQLQRLIDEGGVTVNGRTPKSSTRLRSGDRVDVYVPPPPPSEVQPEDIPLDVLFEDDHLIVLNKRPDIIVHPARAHNKGTLINALAFHFRHRSSGALSTVGKDFARPGVVHRLDRNTSGLIIFAKTDEAHWRIGRQFELRSVDKRYLAIVHGLYEPPVDVIDLPLGPHPSREKGYREKYVVRHDELGKPALTIARVRRRFRADPADPALPTHASHPPAHELLPASPGWRPPINPARTPSPGPRSSPALSPSCSLIELELKTGRTHQIRVHLSHRGFSIVGDDMYGGRPLFQRPPPHFLTIDPTAAAPGSPPLIARQALHAATLAFRHPVDNRPMTFSAPLPPDMLETLAALSRMDPSAPGLTPAGATIPDPMTGA